MKRFSFFKTIIALVLLIIVAGISWITSRDPNDYKDFIAEQFLQATGRTLVMHGEIGLTIYPWFGLSLNDVEIGNAPGFGDEPMLTAEYGEVRIKLMPIFNNKYEIDTVKLRGAHINLAVSAEGQTNWADLLADPQDSTTASEGGKSLPLGNFVVGGVDVSDVSVVFDDRTADVRYNIDNLVLKTDELVYGAPINLNLTLDASATRPQLAAVLTMTGVVNYDIDNGRYQLEPLNLNARLTGDSIPGGSTELTLTTSVLLNLNDDTLNLNDLNLNVLNTSLVANLSAQNILTPTPNVQGDIALNGDDLALLFKAAEIEPLASQLAAVSNRRFSLTSTMAVDLRADTVNVSSLQASLLGASIEGSLQASRAQTTSPSVKGTILASGPDLPLVVEVAGQLTGGRNSQLSQAGRELRVISDKSFSVNADFDANLQSGNIIVSTLDARLLDSQITGNLSASNLQSDVPVVKGNLHAEGRDLPLLMQIAGWFQGGVESTIFQYGENLSTAGNKAFAIDTEFDADWQRGNIEIPELRASALGLELDGKLSTRDMNNRSGSIAGNISLNGSDFRELLVAVGQADLADVLQRVAVDIQLSGSRTDMRIEPLQTSLVFSGPMIPNSPVTLTLDAASRVDISNETLTVNSFSLSGLGLNATGSVNANNILANPGFSGQLNVANFNLRSFMQQTNQTLPATADTTVLQSVALGTAFRGTADSIELSELELVLDETTLVGSFRAANFASPEAEFDLAIDSINVDRYLAPASATATASRSDAPAATEIPVELLKTLKVAGKLDIEELTVSGMDFAGLSATINAADGRINLAPLRTNLYSGSFEGNVSLDVTEDLPVASLDTTLSQVDLHALLQDMMSAGYISGNGNIQMNLRSAGLNTDDIKRNLTGSGRIALNDGVFTGVDVAAVLGQVETMLRSRIPAELQRGEQTAFETFGGTLTVRNGVISSNDLLIKSPGFQVAGKGTLLDLNSEAINFDLVTSVDSATATRNTQQFDIGDYSIPIACTGTLSTPRCLPDAGEIIRTALVREVQDRVGGLLQRALGTDQIPVPAAPTNGGRTNISGNPAQGTVPQSSAPQTITVPRVPPTSTASPAVTPQPNVQIAPTPAAPAQAVAPRAVQQAEVQQAAPVPVEVPVEIPVEIPVEVPRVEEPQIAAPASPAPSVEIAPVILAPVEAPRADPALAEPAAPEPQRAAQQQELQQPAPAVPVAAEPAAAVTAAVDGQPAAEELEEPVDQR